MANNTPVKTKKINFPNILTLIRIALVPPIILLILVPWGGNSENAEHIQSIFNIITASLFLIAALTDLFDGAIARRFVFKNSDCAVAKRKKAVVERQPVSF